MKPINLYANLEIKDKQGEKDGKIGKGTCWASEDQSADLQNLWKGE